MKKVKETSSDFSGICLKGKGQVGTLKERVFSCTLVLSLLNL